MYVPKKGDDTSIRSTRKSFDSNLGAAKNVTYIVGHF